MRSGIVVRSFGRCGRVGWSVVLGLRNRFVVVVWVVMFVLVLLFRSRARKRLLGLVCLLLLGSALAQRLLLLRRNLVVGLVYVRLDTRSVSVVVWEEDWVVVVWPLVP